MLNSNNAAEYFVDRHVAEGRAEKLAFVEAGGGRKLTYGALAEQTDKMVDLFRRHDVRRDERAAVIALDTLDYPTIFWGSLKAGVIPVLINTLLASDGYRFILEDCRARVLFISSPLLPAVAPFLRQLPDLEVVFVIGGDAGGYLEFEAELAASRPGTIVHVSPDEPAFWLYSSGSTGEPKGVVHVHSSLKATADTYAAQVLGIEKEDVTFSAAKLFFAYGLGNGMTFPMSVGATSVLFAGRPAPDSVLAAIAETRPTLFFGVPTLYAAILDALQGGNPDQMQSLRLCVSAGEALPANIGHQWRDMTGVDILDGIGSTEMLHIFLSNSPDDVAYGTSGKAVPGYRLRLVDEAGDPVADGDIGELLVCGPSSAEKYWNQRQKSRDTFEGNWTRTGDKYHLDERGYHVYDGRTDDMFKVSGIWVSPFEVEQALVAHDGILEAAVVAHQDDRELIKPKAYVVLNARADPAAVCDELKEFVKQKIGKWKYPRWIEIVDDLPKTATGKIQRFKLRQ